jgi:hypothetical protein
MVANSLRFRLDEDRMVNYEAGSERRMVEVLSWIALTTLFMLLTVGAVKLFWSWPAEPLLQFLR